MSARTWRFHPEAAAEANHAASTYAEVDAELAADFRIALDEMIAALKHTPAVGTAQRVGRHLVHHCRLRRFPHTVFFAELGDEYLIAAVAHVRRRPGYWKKRLRAAR